MAGLTGKLLFNGTNRIGNYKPQKIEKNEKYNISFGANAVYYPDTYACTARCFYKRIFGTTGRF
jgi:hypothetical protein